MRQYQFPPVVSDPKVKTSIDNYLRRAGELTAANRALVELESRREAVEQEDRRAYAEALKADDKAAPAPVALQAFERDVAEARRRAAALELLVAQAEAELVQVVEDRRSAWSRELDRQTEKSRAEAAKAVTALETAVAELTGVLAARLWLNGFPARTTMVPPKATARVAGLTSPNGEGHSWASVAAALRQFVEPPAEPARPVLREAVSTGG